MSRGMRRLGAWLSRVASVCTCNQRTRNDHVSLLARYDMACTVKKTGSAWTRRRKISEMRESALASCATSALRAPGTAGGPSRFRAVGRCKSRGEARSRSGETEKMQLYCRTTRGSGLQMTEARHLSARRKFVFWST